MKEKLKQSWFSLLVIAITIVTWLIALPFLPNDIPMQYNDVGNVTWRTNKFIAFLLILLLCCFAILY
ncbi:putative membrane protein [Staphylococcus hominis]